jgi:periplasmic divalent cation tolerance protein
MPTDTLIVLCTCPERETGLTIAEHLVDRSLAACVNLVGGVTSVYRWEGQTESAQEVLLVIKTRDRRFAEVQQAILELHPYELPEIVAVSVENGLPGYLNWIVQCTTITA